MLSASRVQLIKTRGSLIPRSVRSSARRHMPAPAEMRPWTVTPQQPGKKREFVVRPFQRDGHVAQIQHVENRGMYREELDIERARFPKAVKTLAVQCDGALSEREVEFAVPPVLVLFRDRHAVHLENVAEHRRVGSDALRCIKGEPAAVRPAPQEAHEQKYNLLCFPYAVPTKLPMRAQSCLVKAKATGHTAQ